MIQSQPQEKDGAVVIDDGPRALRSENGRSKESRNKAPGADEGVRHNKVRVVENKPKPRSGAVSEARQEDYGKEQKEINCGFPGLANPLFAFKLARDRAFRSGGTSISELP